MIGYTKQDGEKGSKQANLTILTDFVLSKANVIKQFYTFFY